ncbi:hypothetical protein [Pectobacterium odoriferum]|nr:hypothetical protein [Pectobacterium odoriferum]
MGLLIKRVDNGKIDAANDLCASPCTTGISGAQVQILFSVA